MEASLVVGRTTAWLALLAQRFFFFANTIFFLLTSPNVEPGPRLRDWLYLQGSTAFGGSTEGMVFTQKWYLTYFLLPLLINFRQAYLSGWGGEGVCV